MRPLDEGHVTVLAEIAERWPPILVSAGSMLVLDGAHRVAAARKLGLTSIDAVLFDGDDRDAFAEAVQRNNAHGLPLTLAERRNAAARILDEHAEWSDRAIAQICALDHKTVGKIRGRDGNRRPSGELHQLAERVGRDGRRRPVNPLALRTRILEALAQEPGASLRAIARRVGASPETVRDVRARLGRGEDPVPAGLRTRRREPRPPVELPAQLRARWAQDNAFRSDPQRAEFASWFDDKNVGRESLGYVPVVPLSRVYEVVEQARVRAEIWRSFAQRLELRAQQAGHH